MESEEQIREWQRLACDWSVVEGHIRNALEAATEVIHERDAEVERLRDEVANYGHAMLLRFDARAAKSTDLPTYIGHLLRDRERLRAQIAHCERCGGDYANTGLNAECACLHIARLRAALEWASERSGPSGRGMIAGLCLGEIQDATEAALRGDWPAVRAAGVVLPEPPSPPAGKRRA